MTQKRKYLQRYASGDIYFRYQGKVLAKLPADESSKEFATEYDRLMQSIGPAKHKVGRPAKMTKPVIAPNKLTIGHFATKWKASHYFTSDATKRTSETYALGTQHNYRLAIDILRTEKITDIPLTDLTPRNCNLFIQKMKRERGGGQANTLKAVLSNIWQFARGFPEFDYCNRSNPLKGGEIDAPYEVEQEHLPWPEDVQDAFLEACGPNLRFAYYLLLCTGQRISDVVRMKWDQFDGTYIRLASGQKKDRDKTPLTIKVPKVLLREIEQRTRTSDYMLTHRWGGPYTRDSLGHHIKDVLIAIEAGEYTCHGLRKNAGITLAENGATVPVIMAALGHKTPKMALYYCRLANQRLLNEQAAEIIDMAFTERLCGRSPSAARACGWCPAHSANGPKTARERNPPEIVLEAC